MMLRPYHRSQAGGTVTVPNSLPQLAGLQDPDIMVSARLNMGGALLKHAGIHWVSDVPAGSGAVWTLKGGKNI